jgi:hypothetical protein
VIRDLKNCHPWIFQCNILHTKPFKAWKHLYWADTAHSRTKGFVINPRSCPDQCSLKWTTLGDYWCTAGTFCMFTNSIEFVELRYMLLYCYVYFRFVLNCCCLWRGSSMGLVQAENWAARSPWRRLLSSIYQLLPRQEYTWSAFYCLLLLLTMLTTATLPASASWAPLFAG